MENQKTDEKFSFMFLERCQVKNLKYFAKARHPHTQQRIMREISKEEAKSNSIVTAKLVSEQPLALSFDGFLRNANSLLFVGENKNGNSELYYKNENNRIFKVDKEKSTQTGYIEIDFLAQDKEIQYLYEKQDQ